MASDNYYNLGIFTRAVSTQNAAAQRWFDRGLVWNYGFNHDESVQCFRRALVEDPECAMALWGIAFSLGPNYNKPWEVFDEKELQHTLDETRAALTLAKTKASSATRVERALIEALQHRYPPVEAAAAAGAHQWNVAYAKAMESVYTEFPDDLDVTTLYVDALMNLTPWKLWDLRTGTPLPGARTLDAKVALERGLALDAFHPGLLHLYIHLMEMSQHPEAALRVADNLRGLVPDSGHLNHMPSHLDILVGDYRRAIASNTEAIRADARFAARDGAMNFYTLYRCHDFHFRLYAAMFAGQSRVAIDTVLALEESLPEALLRVESPPMADWLEAFRSMRVHVLIRFGRWADVIALALPTDRVLHSSTTAMIHYGKGVALAATGRVGEAEKERALFQEAKARLPGSRTLFNNTVQDILGVASAMLDGELEYRRGNVDEAFVNLERAIELNDALPFDEPWGWMQPVRHAYGALLLEQDRVEEAVDVYAADLGFSDLLPRALQHRGNVWALHGYYEGLVKLGRVAEARVVKPSLELAVAGADVPIKSSCFCRKGGVNKERVML
ncbi:TPR domain protein [Lasiosphaeria hispida]|uniref:TPR domain protein n=1 Tax=Lasiosphaeria hispida TaxID=260671 RepID=A0AAJ0HXL7_9PEZI|nr:TPR domain protein [Lasiosphaeria hispida]